MTRDSREGLKRRYRAGTLDPAMVRALKEEGDNLAWLAPGRRPRTDVEMARDLVSWSTENDGRRPSSGATDPGERKAGQARDRLTRKARAGTLSKEANELAAAQFGAGWAERSLRTDLKRKPRSTS